MDLLKKIFSITEESKHRKIQVLGIKFKFRRNKRKYLKEIDKIHLPYVETHLVDHCNLNCRGCTHFCPLSPETFADAKQFEKDMQELAKKCDITEIRLLGGEPLLHPDVCEFVKITRKTFPQSDILLLTNGILLQKMPQEFWQTLRENDVIIEISEYPVKQDFEGCLKLIKENNVRTGFIHDVDDFMLMLNPNVDSNIKRTFKKCPNKHCVNFHKGKLVVCPFACYMYHYNEYFNTNLPEESGIDVSTSSAKDIFKYLQRPPKTCACCTSASKVKLVPWSVSKKQADEWYAISDVCKH